MSSALPTTSKPSAFRHVRLAARGITRSVHRAHTVPAAPITRYQRFKQRDGKVTYAKCTSYGRRWCHRLSGNGSRITRTLQRRQARCGLQVLACRDGKHPWYYKPLSCWLLPIKISDSEIHLYDCASDPFRFPDYDGFVSRIFCGQTSDCGLPAAEVLKPELEFLGRILHRNLISEVNGEALEIHEPQST